MPFCWAVAADEPIIRIFKIMTSPEQAGWCLSWVDVPQTASLPCDCRLTCHLLCTALAAGKQSFCLLLLWDRWHASYKILLKYLPSNCPFWHVTITLEQTWRKTIADGYSSETWHSVPFSEHQNHLTKPTWAKAQHCNRAQRNFSLDTIFNYSLILYIYLKKKRTHFVFLQHYGLMC